MIDVRWAPDFDVHPVVSNQGAGGRIGAFAGSWTDLVDLVIERFQPDGLRLARRPVFRRIGLPSRRVPANRESPPLRLPGVTR